MNTSRTRTKTAAATAALLGALLATTATTTSAAADPAKATITTKAATTAVSITVVGSTAATAATTTVHRTDAQIAALTPQDQGRLLDPLRAIADAVGTAGDGPLADIYGNLQIDANDDLVVVYLTDPAQAGHAVAAALAVNRTIDVSRIQVRPAAATHRALDAASQHIVALADAHQLSYAIGMVGPAADASGVEVDVAGTPGAPPPTASAVGPLATLGVPVHYRAGHPLEPKSWADVKWHDSSPFIGGDAITASGSGHGCTAGLPAVRKSDNHPFMVTAAHCFGVGTAVYTRAGTAGDYSNGLKGNYVGTVTDRDTAWDAEILDGADNNADESDTSGWLPLTSYAYSYDGDYVCHDGQRSFFLGHPTPCGIKVTDQDKYCGPTTGCPGLSYTARGVWGVAVNNGWGSAGGDSGATIFAVESGGVRQARGLLSDGDPGDGAPGVFWTEATDIFNHWGLTLNPRT